MKNTKFERVRGLNDILPEICAIDKQIESQLQQNFTNYGYRPIDVPLLEHTELYLKKAGEDIVDRLYDFTYRNRRLCLRPEMTASVVRSYVDNLQNLPLPLRLYYHGAAFRYERPQKGRFRQFTQMGIELIGASGTMADAEVIATSIQGLEKLGLSNYRVVIAHIGVLNKFLDSLQIESRLRSFLLANMEILQTQGKADVEKKLHKLYPSFANVNQSDIHNQSLINLLSSLEEKEARDAILDLLNSMNVQLTGTRDPEEIVTGLLHKITRQNEVEKIKKVLEFMSELGQIKGDPISAIKEAKKLLSHYQIDDSGLDQLQEIMNILAYYPLDKNKISLNFGMSRGLQYYTGMIFEIHHGKDDEMQIAGGGRYDDLVTTFGGRNEIPATGFAYGLERVRMSLEIEGKLPFIPKNNVEILVIPVTEDDLSYGINVAETLRKENIRVEIDVRNRNLSSNIQYADKQSIPLVIIVGKDEKNTATVVLRNMISKEQNQMNLSDAIAQIKQ